MRGGMRAAHHVNDGAVLNVRAIADPDRVDVAANDDVHPDAALLANLDVADDLSALVDIGGRMDFREDWTGTDEARAELYAQRNVVAGMA